MNIANQLTIGRIFMIPVFIVLMYLPSGGPIIELLGAGISLNQFLAGIVFALASLTDYLDGYLARKYNLITALGAFFDPMADKLLVMAAFIILTNQRLIPAWIVIVIVSRELLVTGLRVLLARYDGKVMAAAWPGKIKTFTQMLAILCYLFNNAGFILVNIPMADICLYLCLFFTVYSGLEYFYKGRFVFEKSKG